MVQAYNRRVNGNNQIGKNLVFLLERRRGFYSGGCHLGKRLCCNASRRVV